jgi:SAM-dependent methyltransferase
VSRYRRGVQEEDGYFDEAVAARYDDTESTRFARGEIDAAADLLAELAAGGRALEFAIGTGRIALPLAARGVDVAGIELSRAMVARLRDKPGGADIPVVIGDMATATIDGPFSLVYLVYNTIENLTSQDAQVACFRNAAAHLSPGGCFLIEVGVPGLQHLPVGATHEVFHASDDYWGIDEYDVVNQRLISHHIENDGGAFRRVSMPFRYAWPAEFDLMAQIAGMAFRDRWAGWRREPFTAESRRHVSVWQTPA